MLVFVFVFLFCKGIATRDVYPRDEIKLCLIKRDRRCERNSWEEEKEWAPWTNRVFSERRQVHENGLFAPGMIGCSLMMNLLTKLVEMVVWGGKLEVERRKHKLE